MMGIDRRRLLTVSAGAAAFPRTALAQGARLEFMAAGPRSAFLPYGQGLAKVIAAANAAEIAVKQSNGSIDNLAAVGGMQHRSFGLRYMQRWRI